MSCCGGRESDGEQATLLEGERSGVIKNRKIVVAGYSGVGRKVGPLCGWIERSSL